LIENILSPLDGTPAAETGLAWARQTAEQCGASLELFTVVDTTEHEANGNVAEAEAYLGAKRDGMAQNGLEVTTRVAVGAPVEQILNRAATANLTVMTYHTRLWLHGGPLDVLLNEMVNPVVVVRGHEGQIGEALKCERVLAPIANTSHSRGALPTAIGLCEALGASLVLCNIVSPIPGAYDKKRPPPEIAQAIDQQVYEAEELVAKAVADLARQGVNAEWMVRVGEPAREIMAAAREAGCGLIAMATRGSDSMSRMMGSVALGVLQASPIPCLLVRPGAERETAIAAPAV
jgi:nucleotide-binding universal stress UspA family protein